MELKWVYRARGGEAFMTLGIFKRQAEIPIQYTGSGNGSCYVYIDDVSLVPGPAHAAELQVEGDLMVCDSTGAFNLSINSPHHSDILWSTGDTTRSITVSEPGIYTVWASYDGCYFFHDTIEIKYLPMQVLDLGPDTVLCAQDFPFHLSAPEGMDAWLWSTGDTVAEITVHTPGTYTVRTDHFCGVQWDTVVIGRYDLVPPDLGQDTVICGDAPIAIPLSAPPGYTDYLWSNGSTDPAVAADAPGLWWVSAAHPCGVFSDSIAITRQPILSLSLPSDTIFCLENGLTLALPSGFDTYTWSTGQTNAAITIHEPGTYHATAVYACGSVSDTVVVYAAPRLMLDLPERIEVQLGDVIYLDPGAAGQDIRRAQWQPDAGIDCAACPTVTVQPPATALYTVEMENGNGCIASEQVLIVVQERRRIFVPNAFSPNDDGINDLLRVFTGPEVRQIKRFQVFDRWGSEVFRRNDVAPNDGSRGWDGTHKGRPVSPGVYVYRVAVELINGAVVQLQGEVTVLR
ncbi:MAG: gliding motility-associated C-terminal domain-containing protein [Saprospiraceae bacterium]|nr:gliding motility-associated C-terminal domain-containing protein [Saprospiraceae bacterium]